MVRQQTLHVALFLLARACVSRLLFHLSRRGRNGYCSKIRNLLFTLAIMDGRQGYYSDAQVL